MGGWDGCARSKLIDGTGTGYLASDRQRAGAVELERAIVRNVACKGARLATSSDSERSGGYCRSTAIAMITGQGEEAAVLLSKACEGSDACAVESARDCIVDNQAVGPGARVYTAAGNQAAIIERKDVVAVAQVQSGALRGERPCQSEGIAAIAKVAAGAKRAARIDSNHARPGIAGESRDRSSRRAFQHAIHDQCAVAIHRERCSSRSEEHTSELQSLMRISYAVFCLKKK